VGIVRVHDTARVIGGQLATIQSVLLHTMSRWLSIKIRRTLPFGAEGLASDGFVQYGLQIAAQVQ
jgi:hypothetical protein